MFTLVIRDVSERKALYSRLAMTEKVLEATSEGVILSDAAGNILWVNGGFSRISGYSRDEAIGQTTRLLKSGLQGPSFYQQMWEALQSEGEWAGEIWNRRKDGEAYPEWLTIKTIHDENGQPERFVGVFSDISKHKRAQETIRHLTYYDPVTRLPNRYLFQDRLSQAMERARRSDRRVALVLVSLDRFKTINETLGHQVGDALLREVAQRLTTSVRGEDTVSRLRGDTFCCVLAELNHTHDANPVINRILDAFTQPFLINEHELFITSSLGISMFPLDGAEIDDLLQKAESAVSRSKERAENSYHFYTPEMNANSMERLRLETDLRKAINRDELVLYYQPKVEVATGRLLGAEALVRWRHPEYGMVPPGRFIPIAEDTGLILPIGSMVLHQACHQIKDWLDQGLEAVPVAVNLSAHQFRQTELVQAITRVIADAGIPRGLIELELTESAVMRNADTAVMLLNELHGLGLTIAIDDFGTGYSSLSYLKKFPIDRLKVDRSFVQDLGTNQAGEEIVGAIIALAHSLKMSVIAEGVENSRQLDMLRELKCEEVQGFYFGRPVPADEFAKLLKAGILVGRDTSSD
jgi:diguanylate cyclase (GGDEF)-like protein/PAS domain S-box-containing protein